MKYGLSSLPEIRWPLSRTANAREFVSCVGHRFLRFAKTRSFAILLYAVLASIVLGTVALNTKVVQVTDESGTRVIYTFRSDPVAILRQGGIHLSKEDQYAFTGIKNNYGRITFFAAFPVQVTADGKTQSVMFANGTVADVLKKAGLKLGTDDIVNVKPEQMATSGLHIVVTRVRFETSNVQTPIPYQTLTLQDATLAQGTQKVLTAGQNGVQTVILRLKYEDGKLVEQTEAGRTATQPVNAQIAVGTASSLLGRSSNASTKTAKSITGSGAADGGFGSYSKVFTGVATAYTQKKGTLTATGRPVSKGLVAVDPDMIPYGSKLYIATPDRSYIYGKAVAADTGGFVSNGSGILTDLFLPTQAECSAFGRKIVNIYVLN